MMRASSSVSGRCWIHWTKPRGTQVKRTALDQMQGQRSAWNQRQTGLALFWPMDQQLGEYIHACMYGHSIASLVLKTMSTASYGFSLLSESFLFREVKWSKGKWGVLLDDSVQKFSVVKKHLKIVSATLPSTLNIFQVLFECFWNGFDLLRKP